VDKPAGPTSHDAVALVRRRFGTRAVGHTGTLDPFATGLLVLVLGAATRLARFLESQAKEYVATARLGQRTTTEDPTGEVIGGSTPERWPEREVIAAALADLVGRVRQRPPAFSAKHVGGDRSHRLARRGIPAELAAVEVEVFALELLEYLPPLVRFRAVVGPGTYIRALARDLGDRLGPGAHLVELRRNRIGGLRVEAARPLDSLTGTEPLVPPVELVGHLPRVFLQETEVEAVRHGQVVGTADTESGEAALLAGERLVAIARPRHGRWHPFVVLSEP